MCNVKPRSLVDVDLVGTTDKFGLDDSVVTTPILGLYTLKSLEETIKNTGNLGLLSERIAHYLSHPPSSSLYPLV